MTGVDVTAFNNAIDKLHEVEEEIDLAYYAACSDNPALGPIANCLERTSRKLTNAREALHEIVEVAKLAAGQVST